MEFELLPGIPLCTGTYHALVVPEPVIAGAINASDSVPRFTFLYVGGSSSWLLASLHRRSPGFDVQQAGTATELKKILDTAYHTIILVEYRQSWYEGSPDDAARISGRLKELAQNSLVILCTSEPDRSFDFMSRQADRFLLIRASPVRERRYDGYQHHSGNMDRTANGVQHVLAGL